MNNIKCGIAIKPNTKWDKLKPFLDQIDQVIIMTVEPGFGGQKFMPEVLEKTKKLKEIIESKNFKQTKKMILLK